MSGQPAGLQPTLAFSSSVPESQRARWQLSLQIATRIGDLDDSDPSKVLLQYNADKLKALIQLHREVTRQEHVLQRAEIGLLAECNLYHDKVQAVDDIVATRTPTNEADEEVQRAVAEILTVEDPPAPVNMQTPS